jgi:hypothetical protein
MAVGTLISLPKIKETTSLGILAEGYKMYTLAAGSVDTLVNTYTDADCTVLNTNPIVLDVYGECVIWTLVALKLVYCAPTSDYTNPIWEVDDIPTQTQPMLTGTSAGTVNSQYEITTSPSVTTLSNNLTLVMTPDADSVGTLGADTFAGTGINDAVFSGQYLGAVQGSVFSVTIDSLSPGNGFAYDTFKWAIDAAVQATGVQITGIAQSLSSGLYVRFARITGHTLADVWSIVVNLAATADMNGTGAKIIYKNVSGSLVALESGDIKDDFPAVMSYGLDQDCWVLINPSAPLYTAGSLPAPTRTRTEVVANYTIKDTDAGNELVMTVTGKIFQLPLAADFADNFVYLQSLNGTTTITSNGTEKIYLPYDVTGATTMVIGSGYYDTVQLQSDSVGWHVVTITALKYALQVLTGSGNWTCPVNVRQICVTASAGGGGGAGAAVAGIDAGGGGDAGGFTYKQLVTVVPGTVYAYAVGAAGTAGTNAPGAGGNGGGTSLGALVSLNGGTGGAINSGLIIAASFAYSGMGKGGMLGSGGRPKIVYSGGTSVAGEAGIGYGSGGSGGASVVTSSAVTGAAGAAGLLILEWWNG